jgi:hypothetical protein
MTYHHKPIKRFSLEGSIYDEATIPRLKEEYVRLLTTEMRYNGYVPRIDIDPDFTIEYVEYGSTFKFELSVYGIYVGKRKVEWIQGIDGHRPIYTQSSKSEESSKARV